jgi:4-amino-4-deoxy-L-arabinose transferase-like glycosyltransferase
MHKAMTSPVSCLVVAYLSLGVLYALATPPFEASDEIHHYPVVRNIASGQGLPVQTLGLKTAWAQEGSQPPAYYLLAASLTSWIDTSDFEALHVSNPFAKAGIPGTPQNANQTRAPAEILDAARPLTGTFLAVYLIRAVSILMGAGTVVCAYVLGRSLSDDKWLALLAASLVAFNPMFLFISASVNNDNLVWLEACLALVVIVRLVIGPVGRQRREIGARWWHAPLLGLLLGMAALTKISGLILWPVAGLALVIQAWRTRQWATFFVNSLIVASAAVATAAWWYVRNLSLYGELLGIQRMAAVAGLRGEHLSYLGLLTEWRSFAYSYWGLFGAFSILAPAGTYEFYFLLMCVAVTGVVLALFRGERPTGYRLWSWLLLGAFAALTGVGVVRWTMMTLASQGRLMFTAIAPLSLALAAGLCFWMPSGQRPALTGILVMVLGSVAIRAVALSIAPAYLPPRPLSRAQLPSEMKKVNVWPAPGVELLGYQIDELSRQRPGQNLGVTLYWRADRPIDVDYSLFLHVLARGRTLVGNIDTWPGGGLRPTSFWRPGDIYPDRYVIMLRDDTTVTQAAPSTLQIDMAMWQNDPDRPFVIHREDGQRVPSISIAAGSLVPAVWPDVPNQDETLAQFDGGIILQRGQIPATASPGVPLSVRLWWQSNQKSGDNYTIFIHAVDARGELAAQADSQPLSGYWPTSLWRPDEVVEDQHLLTIKSAGDYHVLVGLYDAVSGDRLGAVRTNGINWPDGEIDLGLVKVE